MVIFYDFWDRVRDGLRRFFSLRSESVASGSGAQARIYLGNLSYGAKEEEIRSLFSAYGKVEDIHIVRDRLTRKPKGYAFIEMPSEDASKAMALSGCEFLGRKIIVSQAKSKRNDSRKWKGRRRNGRSFLKDKEKPKMPRYE